MTIPLGTLSDSPMLPDGTVMHVHWWFELPSCETYEFQLCHVEQQKSATQSSGEQNSKMNVPRLVSGEVSVLGFQKVVDGHLLAIFLPLKTQIEGYLTSIALPTKTPVLSA